MDVLFGPIRWIYGVDFSGAVDAGKKVWIAKGTIEEEILQIKDCRRAEGLPGSGRKRNQCLSALREFISKERNSAFGLDFPFGLPNEVVHKLFEAGNWLEFIPAFTKKYSHPEQFKKECLDATNGKEIKRVTDEKNATPFSPYNLRLYKQTYFGLHDILAPLVQNSSVCVLPIQSAEQGKPWILEICPASTLKMLYMILYKEKVPSYKGGTLYDNRAKILDRLLNDNPISIPEEIRSIVRNDNGGDALDSILAAFATFRAIENMRTNHSVEIDKIHLLEGFVFV